MLRVLPEFGGRLRSHWGRTLCLGLALVTLAACDEITALTAPQEPLTRATLADGAVALRAPQGYCIDPRSLRRSFALLARCDTLGADGIFAGAELAVISVSTAPLTDRAENGSVDVTQDSSAAVLSEVSDSGLDIVRFRLENAPFDGAADSYWRAAYVQSGQLVSLALYPPAGSAAAQREGARILGELARRSRAAGQGA